jgi:predicted aspartyl protease
MSIFRYPLEIGDPQGEHFEQVDALVDTGATFTVVPSAILDRLGVELSQRAGFRLADGAAIQRGIGETQVRIEGQTFSTTVGCRPCRPEIDSDRRFDDGVTRPQSSSV